MKRIILRDLCLGVIAFSGLILSQCSKDEKTAPPLPPQSSFAIDFSDFSYAPDASIPSGQLKSGQIVYWNYAASNVTFWSAVLYITSAIPVAAFAESFNHPAEYVGNATWEWKYDVSVNIVTYSARLQGTVSGDSVHWKMYLSRTGIEPFSDFVWFEGTCDYHDTGGYWTLYESPIAPNSLFRIDWSRESDEVGTVKYTYTKPGADGIGNYIEFGSRVDSDPYNAYFTIADIYTPQTINIEWNSTTKVGKVKNSYFFGDENWYCWDSTKANTSCE